MTTDRQSDLDDLVEFPAPWTFRAVGATTPTLRASCRSAVEGAIGRAAVSVVEQPSSKGRWTAVRVKTVVESSEEVLAAYAALWEVEGIIKCL